jgi:hypothetical protein
MESMPAHIALNISEIAIAAVSGPGRPKPRGDINDINAINDIRGWRGSWDKPRKSLMPSASEASHKFGTFRREAGQTACKPGSVPAPKGDGWPFLWDARYRAPRATDPGDVAETPLPVARRVTPIWSCSRWGLPCRFRYRSRGGLLPHRFTLACLAFRLKAGQTGGLFSVALSLGSPPPAVSRHRVSVEPGLSSPLAECSHPAV